MRDETLAFDLRLRAISKPTAEAVERLAKAIIKLVEAEEAEGYHIYSRYTNWPLIASLKEGHGGQPKNYHHGRRTPNDTQI